MTSIADVRDVVRGGLASLGGFGGRLLARVSMLLIAGHYFGAAEFGDLGKIAATVEVGAAVALFGLKRSLIGMLSEQQRRGEPAERLVVEALLASTLLSAVLSGLFGLAWRPLLGFTEPMPAILYFAIPGIVVSDVALTATRFRRVIKWDVATRCVVEPWSYFGLAALFAALGMRQGGLMTAYAGSLVAALVISLVGLIQVYRIGPLVSRPPRLRSLLAIPVHSLPTGIADIGVVLFRRADILILGLFAGPETVGIYFMVQQIVTVPHKMHALFEPMMAPVMADLHHGNRPARLQAQLGGTSRWIFIIQLGLSVLLAAFGDHVLGLFGAHFAVGAPVLAIVLLAELFDGGSILAETALVFARPSVPPVLVTATLAVELAGVGLLTWLMGIEGTALGFLVAMMALAAARLVMLYRSLGIRIVTPAYASVVVIAAATGGLLLALRHIMPDGQPILTVVAFMLGAALYAGAVAAFCATKEDRILFRRLRSRRRVRNLPRPASRGAAAGSAG